jgi:glycerate kinase
MTRILIAPNAFKGTLTAMQAAECIERGLKAALRGVKCVKVPVADGGDGTVQAIADATGGRIVRSSVRDPLGRPVRAAWGVTGDGRSAVIELATASGLALLKLGERNPMKTTTRGTGELIRRALDRGARRILIGIGGSATNDGGAGLARALGVRFLDRRGREIAEGGGALEKLARIDLDRLDPRLREVEIEAACDVDNPLTGKRGAARVYSPQKGATPLMVERLEAGLTRLADVWHAQTGVDIRNAPGAGAAGGAGAGLMMFLGARLRPGVEIVMDAVRLSDKMKGCDLVVTGEGRLDAQTAFGKAPAGVARLAGKLGIPVIAIGGSLAADAALALRKLGFAAWFSALEESMDESELPRRAPAMLARCAEQIGRILILRTSKNPVPKGRLLSARHASGGLSRSERTGVP